MTIATDRAIVESIDLPGTLPESFFVLGDGAAANDVKLLKRQQAEANTILSAQNPWFSSGKAAAFSVSNRCRLVAFFDPNMKIPGTVAAHFGFFATTGDIAAERALFSAVKSWAKSLGAQTLWGPIQLSTAIGYRLLLARATESQRQLPPREPFSGEPDTPLHHVKSLENAGFRCEKRYFTQALWREDIERTIDKSDRHEKLLAKEGYRFEALTPDLWVSRSDQLFLLVDDIFGDNFGFAPLSRGTFDRMLGRAFAEKLDSHASTLAIAPDGDIAGVVLMTPHYGPLATARSGNAVDFEPNFARDFEALFAVGNAWLVLKTIGVAKRYRRRGISEVLVGIGMSRMDHRYVGLLGALIREDNASRKIAASAQDVASYGLFSISLDGS